MGDDVKMENGGGRGGRGDHKGKGEKRRRGQHNPGWKKKKWKGREQFRRNKDGPRSDTWQQDTNPEKFKGRFDSRHQTPASGDGSSQGYSLNFELENADFEEYYKAQNILQEEEWGEFLAILKKQLPATFRINGSGKFADSIRDKLKKEIAGKLENAAELGDEATKNKVVIDGKEEDFEPLKPLAWYPDENGWQIQYSRNQIRKLGVLKEFHEFLKRETEAGNITRQETASMIPPFFLDVKPTSTVLDTCAAPGSKTFQLLEMLHAGAGGDVIPGGYVVANDSDSKRCNLLTHQTKRMASPCLIVTNHEGQKFPVIRHEDKTEVMLFDRILCDVPCSGDGTLRKAPDLWRRWNVGMGLGLHRIQLKIVMKACELLQVGGKLVYSTCSLNPIENEAVVAEILRRTEGSFELMDVSSMLPQLKRRPGMKTWKVRDKQGWISSFAELEGMDESTPGAKRAKADRMKKVPKSCFPDEASDAMPLERSSRIFPHDDNTGGFFISVFKKVANYSQFKPKEQPKEEAKPEAKAEDVKAEKPAVKEEEAKPEASATPTAAGASAEDAGYKVGKEGEKLRVRRWRGIDPVVPVDDEAVKQSLRDFYGIKKDNFDIGQSFVTRTPKGAMPKRIYYVSDSVRRILDEDKRQDIRVTSVGVKIFEKQSNKNVKTAYRIAQEGLPAVLPLMSKQIFRPTLEEFMSLLRERTLVIPDPPPGYEAPKAEEGGDASEGGDGGYIKKQHMLERASVEDPGTLEQFKSINMGCCVAMMKDEDAERLGFVFDGKPLAISCWRGTITVNLLTSKIETDQLLDKFPKELRGERKPRQLPPHNKNEIAKAKAAAAKEEDYVMVEKEDTKQEA